VEDVTIAVPFVCKLRIQNLMVYEIARDAENRIRSMYGENWGNDINEDKGANSEDTGRGTGNNIEIAGALIFWTIMIVIGVLIKIVAIPLFSGNGLSNLTGELSAISGYILYIPGSFIIALIVAAYIGEKVGAAVTDTKKAVRLGVMNAIYAAFIYLIIIVILFLIIKYAYPAILPNLVLSDFLLYMVAIPIGILIIVVPLLSSLSAARHNTR
jgi:hypothetical protein